MTDIPDGVEVVEAVARALVEDPESLGMSRGEGSLDMALSIRTQEVIEDVYADCGDCDPAVLASNIGSRLAYLLHTAIFTAAAPIIRAQAVQEFLRSDRTKPVIYNEWLVEPVNYCTCYGGGPYGHEPGCGLEPLVDLTEQVEAIRADERRRVAEQVRAEAVAIETAQRAAHKGYLPILESGIVAGYEQAARITERGGE